ncbi:MerR family transcriptional regulator [Qipengyuania sp. ASV99]|uniref:MerR family transcriptional regulator n=1 Tax=Qipengyuania sp. ASV99 TaxID=3399681 RepID=UPI003A4C5928
MAEFDDGKDDGALRTIGEVSEGLGIKPHVLRYWEQQFTLLKPLKRSGGRRYYRPADVAMVEAINRLVHEEGYTLKGAEAVLRSSGASDLDRRQEDRRMGDRRADGGEVFARRAADAGPVESPKPDYSETIAKLKGLRARLAKAIEA